MDVGASGTTPEIWNLIARQSLYVGFDPDLREIKELQDGRFWRAIIVNEAVTDDKNSAEVEFYLTKSPYCSSTLKPDTESLSNFLFADLFLVESCAKVQIHIIRFCYGSPIIVRDRLAQNGLAGH